MHALSLVESEAKNETQFPNDREKRHKNIIGCKFRACPVVNN